MQTTFFFFNILLLLCALNSWQVLKKSLNQGETYMFLPHMECGVRGFSFAASEGEGIALFSSAPALSSYSESKI